MPAGEIARLLLQCPLALVEAEFHPVPCSRLRECA
jgi:hypothetical protein